MEVVAPAGPRTWTSVFAGASQPQVHWAPVLPSRLGFSVVPAAEAAMENRWLGKDGPRSEEKNRSARTKCLAHRQYMGMSLGRASEYA